MSKYVYGTLDLKQAIAAAESWREDVVACVTKAIEALERVEGDPDPEPGAMERSIEDALGELREASHKLQ